MVKKGREMTQISGPAWVQGGDQGGGDQWAAPVDGIRVHDDIAELKHNPSHVLLGEGALLTRPLHGGVTAVLDLVQVLHTLGDVDEEVGAVGVGAVAPNLLGQVLVPAEVVDQHLGADLGVRAGSNLQNGNKMNQDFQVTN